jgi:hypothetical protein
MSLATDTIVVSVSLTYGQYRRLRHLAEAISRDGPICSIEGVVDHVLQHLDNAICRPGSWERDAFSPLFGKQNLAAAQEAANAAGD